MAVIGHVEGRSQLSLGGWAWDTDRRAPAPVRILVDGVPEAELTPAIRREDLRAHGLGDGGCAFEWPFPDTLYDGEPHRIEVVAATTGQPLEGQQDGMVFRVGNYRRLPAAVAGGGDPARRVAGVQWFHSFDFGDGVVANGHKDRRTLELEAAAVLSADIAGKRCLDIGAWDGFFSFQAELRGARSVLATDHFSWSGEGWGTADGFRLARELLGSRVEDMDIDALEIAEATVGRHDVVLFLGVLYHLRNPFEGLRAAASVCDGTLVVETTLHLHHVEEAAMQFFPGSELDGDPTNWWSPNPRCVMGMLSALGFRRVDFAPHPTAFVGDPAPIRGIFVAHR
jgi:tRNA (mo5U34)-methyltransferase